MVVILINMPKYTLTYFDGRAMAETSRWLFAIADQPYDDVRMKYGGEEWLALKPCKNNDLLCFIFISSCMHVSTMFFDE